MERSVKCFTGGLTQFHGANLALNSYANQDTLGKVTNTRKHNTYDSQEISSFPACDHKAARNRHDITTHSKTIYKESPPRNVNEILTGGLKTKTLKK